MTDTKITNHLKQIIFNSLKFNVVYLAAGVTVVMLNLVSAFPQILNSDYAINTMCSTIIVPPTILILTAQTMNICLFYKLDKNELLKQKQEPISKTVLTVCRSICLLTTLVVGIVLFQFDVQLSAPLMNWLLGYIIVWMVAQMVTVEL